MDGRAMLPPGDSDFERLIEALRRKDPELNAFASEVLYRAGNGGGPLLVREALGPGKHPDHRIRILDVIQRIGEPLGGEFLNLVTLLNHPVTRVREKAAEVVTALGPGGRSGGGSVNGSAAMLLASYAAPWRKPRRARKRSSSGSGRKSIGAGGRLW